MTTSTLDRREALAAAHYRTAAPAPAPPRTFNPGDELIRLRPSGTERVVYVRPDPDAVGCSLTSTGRSVRTDHLSHTAS